MENRKERICEDTPLQYTLSRVLKLWTISPTNTQAM